MEINPFGLGSRLEAAGLITQDQLEQALQFQKHEGGLIGDILIREGFISSFQLSYFIHSSTRSSIGELLIGDEFLTRTQLEAGLQYQHLNGGRLGPILVDLGFITTDQLNETLSRKKREKRKLGEFLHERGIITEEQLTNALDMQRRCGGKLGDILIFMGYVSEDQLFRAIATQSELGRVGTDSHVVNTTALPHDMAVKYNAIVIREEKNYAQVAVFERLDSEAEKDIEAFLGQPIEQVIMSDTEGQHFWEEVYRTHEAEESIFSLFDEQPDNSAMVPVTPGQKAVLLAMLALLIIAFVVDWQRAALFLVIVCQILYLLMASAKFYIVMKGTRTDYQIRFTDEQVKNINEAELPVYTILIPVYKEIEVVKELIKRVDKFDYPKYKLDVRILLEEDDQDTINVIRSMNLPKYYTPIVVPLAYPKTKPKACNYGLLRAKGEYVVIYDAEDRPEANQLKKVWLAFKDLTEDFVCIQAKLNYFNSTQNWLTKLFTQEYSMWFELLLVGIMQVNVPIPLGGTSNHFKLSFLRQVGGWDPFNVTEDADLGIRLYKFHYKTAVLDSRTWEEANSNLPNWIRQRSRWIKGYMQTLFVNLRNPFEFFRTLGLRGSIGYVAVIFGSPFLPLINPLFWGLLIIYLVTKALWIESLFPGPLYYVALIQFVAGNFMFIYMNMIGTYFVIRDCALKKRQPFSYSMIVYGLITPLYWAFMSVAAYKALFQLILKPFYWEKTRHGLTDDDGEYFDTDSPDQPDGFDLQKHMKKVQH